MSDLDDILTIEEHAAVRILKEDLGFDARHAPGFWEHVVARILGGKTTAHKTDHDVVVKIWGRACHIEVKFSSESWATYAPIRGRDWSRPVFKWALPRGAGGKHGADVIVLIGLDKHDDISTWAIPRDAIKPKCASITVACPYARRPESTGPWDRFAVPIVQRLLPHVAAICHGGA